MAPSSSSSAATTCGCPNQCQRFELLPIDQGIMIMLHVPPSPSNDDVNKRNVANPTATSNQSSAAQDATAIIESAKNHLPSPHTAKSSANCTCLKLHPQMDANLPQFHPNIYIPSPLLDYPDHLVKYGGGGSGVTVFGGYHPLLGNLVMKHGGHKDLIELVSLAKIEREMGVRGKWKMDCLMNEDDDCKMISQTDHNAFASGDDDDAQHDGMRKNNRRVRFTFTAKPTAMMDGNTTDMTKKFKSQPILAKMESIMGRITSFASADKLSVSKGENEVKGKPENDERTENESQIQSIQSAMDDMKRRIPAFRMIYVSPMHLRERKEELKNCTFRSDRSASVGSVDDASQKQQQKEEKEEYSRSSSDSQLPSDSNFTNSLTTNGRGKIIRRHSSVMRKGRRIHLFGSTNTKASSMQVQSDHVDLCFGGNYHRWKGQHEEYKNTSADGSDGYASLMAFVDHLRQEQEKNEWKITLAQQMIGQTSDNGKSQLAMTASSLLAQGKLHGPLLHHLIDNEIQVIRNLQLLTMPEEVDVVEQVSTEYKGIMSRQKNHTHKVSAAKVSSLANDFVGKAIHKNFHPITGRFVMIRQFGVDLRHGKIHLKPKEVVPAKHLENLFYQAWVRADVDGDRCSTTNGEKNGDGSRAMEDTFNMLYRDCDPNNANDASSHHHHHPMFVLGLDQWQSLLELSLSIKHPNATNRIWTCGLTDGGLHNMFLSESQLWFFDLGEPNLEPIPAFLTKFLMSFFHTLGMEEDEKGDWVVRFEQDPDDSGKLRLTQATMHILPKVFQAFNITMDRLIKELFGGEEEIRVLLLRYVVTQLISDAAFCIEKWRIKGGGDEERSEHQYFLEKWLWRALWDVYASEEIRRRYLTRMLFRRQMECRDLSSMDLGSVLE